MASRHHYTKAELAQKAQSLAAAGEFKDIQAPKYLNRAQVLKFYDFSYKLLSIGMTELDEDTLARYIIANDLYTKYAKELQAITTMPAADKWRAIQYIENEDLHKLLAKIIEKTKLDDKATLQKLMDVQFKECRACASDLGLTISDRCKLIVPEQESYEL